MTRTRSECEKNVPPLRTLQQSDETDGSRLVRDDDNVDPDVHTTGQRSSGKRASSVVCSSAATSGESAGLAAVRVTGTRTARTPRRRSDRMRGKPAALTSRPLLVQSSGRPSGRTCSDASHAHKKRALGRRLEGRPPPRSTTR
ncbi:hypothetical protein MTO96_048544 [Rhipicephalus appendiculatus]